MNKEAKTNFLNITIEDLDSQLKGYSVSDKGQLADFIDWYIQKYGSHKACIYFSSNYMDKWPVEDAVGVISFVEQESVIHRTATTDAKYPIIQKDINIQIRV